LITLYHKEVAEATIRRADASIYPSNCYAKTVSNYDVIAKFYDSVVADPSDKARWLKQLIQTYNPTARSVLELACGTGGLLVVLAETYRVAGLDNSAGMLTVAREKLPDAPFFQADMADFTLGEQFDAILCIYDSINHLLNFSEWESLFAHAAAHLNPDGILIFDMNTAAFLRSLLTTPPSVSHFSNNTMTIGARPGPGATTVLEVVVAETRVDGSIVHHETEIPEVSFSVPQVRAALEKKFTVLAELGEQRSTKWTAEDNKIVWVCRRR